MTNVKRYYYFLLGIIAASITWSVVLYLYLRLGNDSSTNVDTNVHSFNNSKQNTKKKLTYNMKDDVVIPYENNIRSLFYQKKKYYKNSAKLIKDLQPVIPGTSKDFGKIVFTITDVVRKYCFCT